MDQPVRGRVRGCLGNQEKEPLRNPEIDTAVGDRHVPTVENSCCAVAFRAAGFDPKFDVHDVLLCFNVGDCTKRPEVGVREVSPREAAGDEKFSLARNERK